MSAASAAFSSSRRSIRSMKDFSRSAATPPPLAIVSSCFLLDCLHTSAAPVARRARHYRRASATARARRLVLVLRIEGLFLLRTRLLLMLRLPLLVGHAVDNLPRLGIRQLQAALLRGFPVPARQAVAAEAREIHEVEILHVRALAQMLHEAAEGGGFQFGAGLVVHVA